MSIHERKVLLVGNTEVGKTSIIYNMSKKEAQTKPTIGAHTFTIKMKSNENDVTLNVWDTAGQDEYKCFIPIFAQGVDVAVIVFDVSNSESYDSVQIWVATIKNEYLINDIFVAANKSDLEFDKDDLKEISCFLDEHSIPMYFTSAVSGKNIPTLFQNIADLPFPEKVAEKAIEFNEPEFSREKSKCCLLI